MKFTNAILFATVLVCCSCINRIDATGHIARENIKIERGYRTLKIMDGINVRMGDVAVARIEADAAAIPFVETIQSDETVTIRLRENISLSKDCQEVYVDLPDNLWLTDIETEGKSSFSTEGYYKINRSINFKASGQSIINAKVSSGEIHASASDNARIYFEGDIVLCYFSLSSNAAASGPAASPFGLTIQTLYANLTADSSIKATCEGLIAGNIGGKARIEYKGSPKIEIAGANGSNVVRNQD